MLNALIAGAAALVTMGNASATDTQTGWDFVGYNAGEQVAIEDAASFLASAYSEDGKALVFLCNDGIGLIPFLVYEPNGDLYEQIQKRQKMFGNKVGTVTIGDKTVEDRWIEKDRFGTLQARDKATGFALLNAAFQKKSPVFSFNRMDDITLDLPEPDDTLMEFVQACPLTQQKK